MTPGGGSKSQHAALLHKQLIRSQTLHEQHVRNAAPSPEQRLLNQWQSQRLAATHQDLLQSPRYKPAIAFFLNDLYGPRDFSQRDHDIERVYRIMARMLPDHVVYSLGLALELNVLTQKLDAALLRVLVDALGVTDHITQEVYAEAYRRCDNYARRKHQIELIRKLGEDLDGIVAKPSIRAALRLARKPAHLAGFGELQEFLERGFRAFHHMRGAQAFLDLVVGREMRILDRIYARHPNPFDLEASG